MNTIRYGGWADDMHLSALLPGREAAKLIIKLTTPNELNGVMYEVSNVATANHRGFTSRVSAVTCHDDNSKVEVSGFTRHDMNISCIVKLDIVMSAPSEKDTDVVIFCDYGKLADIIPAQSDRYRRRTAWHKKKCKHFQWVDGRLTRTNKIFVRNLQAENRSLCADLLTATTILRQYMDAEMGVKLLLQDSMRGQLMSTVCMHHCGCRIRDDIHRCLHLISFPGDHLGAASKYPRTFPNHSVIEVQYVQYSRMRIIDVDHFSIPENEGQ
ncbi:hypothetical protein Cgig2_032850 [Carnegiea gigantea]|uniref:Uncharacterized protein n=1 Tax=Carnegiea gigantea TaxID=171969 RepID=A0A9Q1JNB8_9CARY|nr:hypothetical protein Cgig2_032850 [Carnegiea gigantea]